MKNSWSIKYWFEKTGVNSVEKWFNNLSHEQFKSLAKELKLLERCGNDLRLPHSRTLGQGLFELRERTFGLRVYYSFLKNYTIILLHAGNKKTQQKDIDIARQRLSQFKKHEANNEI